MSEVAVLLAVLIGLLVGAFGGGGSVLTVPVFVYALGMDPKQAIAVSLPVAALTSLVAAAAHWRAGDVHIPTAVSVGLLAMAGAYLGAQAGLRVPGDIQLLLLGTVLVAAAVSMLHPRAVATTRRNTAGYGSWMVATAAVGIGMLTGLIGIGGGFLFVPVLMVLARLPMREAVGTALVVIAMNAVAGFAGYAGALPIPWTFTLGFGTIAAAGAAAGVWVARRSRPHVLQRAFALLLLGVAAAMLLQEMAWSPVAAATVAVAACTGVCGRFTRERTAAPSGEEEA